MKVIVGLGNPGAQYNLTRHNAGVIFVEWLVKQKMKPKQTKSSSNYTCFLMRDNLLIIVPETFMNLSGKAVNSIKRKYSDLEPKNFLIVHDDLQHKLGNVRIKDGGSTQGHNGVQSITKQLKTNSFKRLQLGIARPESRDPQVVSKYVLSKFGKDQLKVLQQNFEKAFLLAKQHQFL